ncbi:MAG: hypothetical protein JST92_11285, partial [Deltaproteobacteria bacterium]|nr:hypothetical protein [Deltaproteobacteria bacterium]
MLLRRIVPIAGLAVLAIGCEPDIAYSAPPGSVLTAVFDPTTSQIPIPNDLILQQDIDSLGLPAAQAELLKGFKAAGGFPNDQEVSATIDFQRVKINADGTTTKVAPDLDLTSLNAGTLIVFGSTAAGNGPIEIEPIKAADYVKGSDRGTLTIHNKGHQPWAPGEYFIIVRGGPNGVHATASDGGDAVYASQTFYLIAQGKDLTDPLNIGLIRAQTQTMQEALALAQQLNTIIGLYQPAFA